MRKYKGWLQDKWKVFVVLAVLVFIAYANSLKNGFVSDDIGGIAKNPTIADPRNLLHVSGFFQNFTHFLIYKSFGLQPLFFRLPNLLIHLGNSFALFAILSLIFTPAISFVAAAVFSVHPLATEAVSWISALSYPLYTFFLLWSLYFFIKFVKKNTNSSLICSIVLYILAATASEKALIFPLVLILFVALQKKLQKNLKTILIYIFLTLLFTLPLIFSLSTRFHQLNFDYGRPTSSFYNPFLQIPLALATYLKLSIWPNALNFQHLETALTSFGFILLLSYLLLLVLTYVKNKQVFFWLVFFFIALLPSLIPYKLASFLAERYAYLALIGLVAGLSALIVPEIKKRLPLIVCLPIFLIIIVIFTTRTVFRNADWKNDVTIAKSSIQEAPLADETLFTEGDAALRQGYYDLAITKYEQGLTRRPQYAKGYNNLGYAYAQSGQPIRAKLSYEQAIQLNPSLWEAYDNLAAIATVIGNFEDATNYEKMALQINKNNNDLIIHLGIIYFKSGDKQKARAMFEQALKFDPNNPEAKKWLNMIQ